MQHNKWPLILLITIASCLAVTFVCVCAAELFFLIQPITARPPASTSTPTISPGPPATPSMTPSGTPAPAPTPTPTGTLEAVDLPACMVRLADLLETAENSTYLESQQFSESYDLALYIVVGDTISQPLTHTIPSDLERYQEDTATQEGLWDYVIAVIPADQRAEVQQFLIYSDGQGGTLGGVHLSSSNPHKWVLMLDMLDMQTLAHLSTTIIHEHGHLLTLNETQVTVDELIYNNPLDQKLFEEQAAACPTYFTQEGCSHSDSYIYQFFQKFWPDIFEEWKGIDAEHDPDVFDQKIAKFYRKYRRQFVSSYAATSPTEDIAESWTYFIFGPRPEADTIAEQKILFFYDFPELVTLRDALLDGLCRNLDRP